MPNTNFLGMKLRNPLVLASGILGTNAEILKRVGKYAGAVTMKSIGPKEKEGNPNPCIIDVPCGLINCVGLPTPGVENIDSEFLELRDIECVLFASIYANSVEDFVKIAKHISAINGKRPDLIELNISCPNTDTGMMFSLDPKLAEEVVRAVKKVTKIPISAKLTPNCNDIVSIARAVEMGGADAITAINTVGPGMVIDIEVKKPVLSFKTGGLSGPMIKPIALRCVYQIYETVKIPIIGTGGVSSGKDAIEMLMAGASLVGVGSAVYNKGPEVFSEISGEMVEWMRKHGHKKYSEIIGAVHG